MTLELLTVKQVSAPDFLTLQHEPAPTYHLGKEFLSDLNVLLTRYQSDFIWR
jgi:hypothetical protein